MTTFPSPPALHGIMAEFATPEELLTAARAATKAGYRNLEAYSPFAVEGLAEAIGFRRTGIPLIMLLGAIIGALGAYAMQWYSAAVAYPLNVGGRPLHSWPAFIPITFELTILFAALAGVIGMLWLNGLPRPYHPVFNAPGFERASQTGFFLCFETNGQELDRNRDEIRAFLISLGALNVMEVAS